MKYLRLPYSIVKTVLFITLLFGGLFSCDSEEDIDLDSFSDPCESAAVFGLNTYDPWSGMTPLFANIDLGSEVVTADAIGAPITYSNASTYNFDVETYHFFNSSNNTFINVLDTSPATIVTLVAGIPSSIYSHIVYVKGVDKYYIIEKDISDTFSIIEIDPYTGIMETSISTEFVEPNVESISITTNNENAVYIMVNRTLITIDNLGTDPTSSFIEVEGLFSSTNLFFGLEYNASENLLHAIRVEKTANVINLVDIDLIGTFTTSYSLVSEIDNKTSILSQLYSTTLSCDERLYKLTYLDGNNNTVYHEIYRNTGLVITNYYEANYYFGIESNANN